MEGVPNIVESRASETGAEQNAESEKNWDALRDEAPAKAEEIWFKLHETHDGPVEIREAVTAKLGQLDAEGNHNRFIGRELARFCTETYGPPPTPANSNYAPMSAQVA